MPLQPADRICLSPISTPSELCIPEASVTRTAVGHRRNEPVRERGPAVGRRIGEIESPIKGAGFKYHYLPPLCGPGDWPKIRTARIRTGGTRAREAGSLDFLSLPRWLLAPPDTQRLLAPPGSFRLPRAQHSVPVMTGRTHNGVPPIDPMNAGESGHPPGGVGNYSPRRTRQGRQALAARPQPVAGAPRL